MVTKQNMVDKVEGYVLAAYQWQSRRDLCTTELLQMIDNYCQQKLQQCSVSGSLELLEQKLNEVDEVINSTSIDVVLQTALDKRSEIVSAILLINELSANDH